MALLLCLACETSSFFALGPLFSGYILFGNMFNKFLFAVEHLFSYQFELEERN